MSEISLVDWSKARSGQNWCPTAAAGVAGVITGAPVPPGTFATTTYERPSGVYVSPFEATGATCDQETYRLPAQSTVPLAKVLMRWKTKFVTHSSGPSPQLRVPPSFTITSRRSDGTKPDEMICGLLNVAPQSVDLVYTIAVLMFGLNANCRHITYTVPSGPTAMSLPCALATPFEILIGCEKDCP